MECLKIINISVTAFYVWKHESSALENMCVILFCIFSRGAGWIAWGLKCCGEIEKYGSRVWNFILFEMTLRKRRLLVCRK